MTANTILARPQYRTKLKVRSFAFSACFVLSVCLFALGIEKLRPDVSQPLSTGTFFATFLVTMMLAGIVLLRRTLLFLMTSNRFAVTVTTGLLVATFASAITANGAAMFSSYWFNAVLALAAISLLLTLSRKKSFRLRRMPLLGFQLVAFTIVLATLL